MPFRIESAWPSAFIFVALLQSARAQSEREGAHLPSEDSRLIGIGGENWLAARIRDDIALRKESQLRFLATAEPAEFVVIMSSTCELLRVCGISHTDVMDVRRFKKSMDLKDCATVIGSTPAGLSMEATEGIRRGPLVGSIGDYLRGGGYVYLEENWLLPAELAPAGPWTKAKGGEGLGVFRDDPRGWHPEAVRLTEEGTRSPFLADAFRGRVINTGGTQRCPCEATHERHDRLTQFVLSQYDEGLVRVLAEAPVGHVAGHEYKPAFVVYGRKGMSRPPEGPKNESPVTVSGARPRGDTSIEGCVLIPDFYGFGRCALNLDQLRRDPVMRPFVADAEKQSIDRAVVLLNFMEVALRDKRARPAAPAAPAKAKPK